MAQVEESKTGTQIEVEVRKIGASDVERVSDVLGRAFDDDPFANWMAQQDERRAERIRHSMKVALTRMTMPFGECYTTNEVQGAALWTPPGKWKLGLLQQLLLMPSIVKTTGLRRVPAVMGGISAVEKKHPHPPHYYLMVLGTEPSLQGKGIGTQLMRPVLERCDREGAPAYLESSKERNLPLYERNGFRVTEEMTVPNGGPKIWLMWRDPK